MDSMVRLPTVDGEMEETHGWDSKIWAAQVESHPPSWLFWAIEPAIQLVKVVVAEPLDYQYQA